MKNSKKIFTGSIVALALAATSVTAFAASAYSTPAEAVAGITGRTPESVVAERVESGKTYGTIAAEAGVLDEFKNEMLEIKKDSLDTQVENGTITKEKADAVIEALEENQAVCDGTGSAKIGQNMGAKFGLNGECQGIGGANRGQGKGNGRGQGGGCGNNGVCSYQ